MKINIQHNALFSDEKISPDRQYFGISKKSLKELISKYGIGEREITKEEFADIRPLLWDLSLT